VTLAAALAANGKANEAHALALVILDQARAARSSWVPIVELHAAEYAEGRRWIESGRRGVNLQLDMSGR